MPARRMRVELADSNGNKYTISFEGQVTREKALRILDLVELLGGIPTGGTNLGIDNSMKNATKYEKVRTIIQRHFTLVWFSSIEVQSVYENKLKEPIGLSTVATYLSRMSDRGMLVKMHSSNHLKYRLASSALSVPVKRRMR